MSKGIRCTGSDERAELVTREMKHQGRHQ